VLWTNSLALLTIVAEENLRVNWLTAPDATNEIQNRAFAQCWETIVVIGSAIRS